MARLLPLLALLLAGCWITGADEDPAPDAPVPPAAKSTEPTEEGADAAWILDRPIPEATAAVIGRARPLAPWVIEGEPQQPGDQIVDRRLLWEAEGSRHALLLSPLAAEEQDEGSAPAAGGPEAGAPLEPHGAGQGAQPGPPPRTAFHHWSGAWPLEGSQAVHMAWRPGARQVELACLAADGSATVTDTIALPGDWRYAGGGSTVMGRGGWLLLAVDVEADCPSVEEALKGNHEITLAEPAGQMRWEALDGTIRATATEGGGDGCQLGLFWAVRRHPDPTDEPPACGWPWDDQR